MLGASNKPIRWGEAVRIADLKPDFGTAPRHPNRPREALDASPHPNGSVKTSHFDLNVNWDGLSGDNKGIYRLFRAWLSKGLKGRACS